MPTAERKVLGSGYVPVDWSSLTELSFILSSFKDAKLNKVSNLELRSDLPIIFALCVARTHFCTMGSAHARTRLMHE